MQRANAKAAILLLALAGSLGACGGLLQAAPVAIPEGWLVSPANTKSASDPGYCIRHEKTGLELVYVPAATYLMGTTEAEGQRAVKELGAYAERMIVEQPAHEVVLSAYWIGRTEVTAGQWRQVMGTMPPPDDTKRDRNNMGDDYPITWMTWDE
ncbi:MAG: SUMF1/EgtB/PvdO family nonheme iron enzyme, partial [Armatimonadetes bacterium]|nr:SUMF1/EgtB/PvdO family nonheme iron enzyme [Armatimonadota bacterium]